MRFVCLLVSVCLAVMGSGCGAKSETDALIAEARSVLNRLPEGDREAALEQWTCPVCGSPLGSQGTPVRTEQGSQPVYFCQQNCADEFARTPAKFQSKLNE